MIRGLVLVSLLAAGFMLSSELGARGSVLDTTSTTGTETVTTTQGTETTSPTTSTAAETTTRAPTTSTRKTEATTPAQVYTPPQTHPAVVRPMVVAPPAHAPTTPRRQSTKPPARRALHLPRASVINRPTIQLVSVSPAPRDNLRRALVAAGFGVALLLFGVGALPAEAVRSRTAALFLYERRIVLVLAGAAVFAAAGLAVLLGK
jgi:hypothetical protein